MPSARRRRSRATPFPPAQLVRDRPLVDFVLAGCALVCLAVLLVIATVNPSDFVLAVALVLTSASFAYAGIQLGLRGRDRDTKFLATITFALALIAGLTSLFVLVALLPCRACG
jgi:hypothetical protein